MNPDLPPAPDAGDARDLARLQAVSAADRPAFDALYRDYYPRLYRFLQRLCHRPDLIDEVIDDTFWTVWRKASTFRGEARPSTWIFGIAYRLAMKALRKRGNAAALTEIDGSDDEALEDALSAQERKNWLDQGLQLLSPEHRSTVLLAYYLGHSCEEIAAIMACPVGTVKARMFHARVRLRSILTASAADEGGQRVQHE